MPLDAKEFRKKKLKGREADVPVPDAARAFMSPADQETHARALDEIDRLNDLLAQSDDRSLHQRLGAAKNELARQIGGVFKVRKLNDVELAQINDAVQRNRSREKIAEALLSPDMDEFVEGLKERLQIGDAVPDTVARQIEMLRLGVVEPKMELEDCIRFSAAWPVDAVLLCARINNLTGLGSSLGKPESCTKTRPSASPSPSVTDTTSSSSA
jgi:hypothetical protein